MIFTELALATKFIATDLAALHLAAQSGERDIKNCCRFTLSQQARNIYNLRAHYSASSPALAVGAASSSGRGS